MSGLNNELPSPAHGKISAWLPLVAFVAIAIFLSIGLFQDPRLLPSTKIGKKAPEFTLPTLDQNDDNFSPQQLMGQPWVLNVWASWCVSCRYEHPLFNQLANQTAIPIVGLNYKDDIDDAKAWLLQYGNPFTYIAVDQKGLTGIDYGVYAVPETFVINSEGNIVYKKVGPVDAETIQQNILPWFESE